MAIAHLWHDRIASSTAMQLLQTNTPVAVGSASDCIPTLRYLARIIRPDFLRMATRRHLTRLDRLLQTKAMAPTSGETLPTPAARTARSIRFNKHRSPT